MLSATHWRKDSHWPLNITHCWMGIVTTGIVLNHSLHYYYTQLLTTRKISPICYHILLYHILPPLSSYLFPFSLPPSHVLSPSSPITPVLITSPTLPQPLRWLLCYWRGCGWRSCRVWLSLHGSIDPDAIDPAPCWDTLYTPIITTIIPWLLHHHYSFIPNHSNFQALRRSCSYSWGTYKL